MAVNYGQVAIVPKGAWNAETQYKVNNLVSYDGSSYVAKVQPPVGTLPTDTSYWQVSAAGTKKATADSLGTVMPDGTTTSVGEDGKLSVNTAQQDALGVVKGSDDITVGEDGTLTVNTTFEQATELANIIAGEAIKSVLGKVSKAIATTMSLDENALLKNMISGIDVNDSNKVPSSAYIHTLVERIGMGTELVSGLGDLTTGLNTVNNNLSNKFKITADNGYTQLSQLMDVGAWSEPFVFDIPYASSLAPASNNAVGIAERGMLHAFDYAGKHFYCIDASKGWQESPYALKSDLWPQSSGTEITAGTDMQTIITPGHYCCGNNGVVASLKNCPMSDAFTLIVYRAAGGSGDNIYYVAQEYTSYLCNRRVIQTYNKDSKKWTTHEIQFKS